ncbi:hypothetical protein [Jannaschia marina]|uniref:hypothetical protein n=1 Tax=Jannaschia marina TaxID=2741674 RepID=UPI0015CCDFF1|nr:hypothetical protein [Jannaschia marina]
MPRGFPHAKYRFPSLGWITYISEEAARDYALDLDALRRLAIDIQDCGETVSAGQPWRFQFHETAEDWKTKTPALIEATLTADRHRYREEDWRELPNEVKTYRRWPELFEMMGDG